MTDQPTGREELLTLTTEIVSSHVANNSVPLADLASIIENVYSTLSRLGTPAAAPAPKQEPAVSVRASVKPDFIVCLEDGKKLKMLKRHLMTHYNMTPAEYRTKWNLPADYPMVAPNYAAQRKELALKIGLGKKPAATLGVTSAATVSAEAAPVAAAPKPAPAAKKAAKPRRPKAAALDVAPVTAASKPKASKARAKTDAAPASPRPRKKLGIAIPA